MTEARFCGSLLVPLLIGLASMTPHQAKPAKVVIVAMGDSTTAGTPAFTSPREAPPRGKDHPDWEVVNQGINGQRSDQIRDRFEADVVDAQPSVVVIIAGVNDVYQGRAADHVEAQLAAMYARAREKGIRVVAGSIIPYNTATAEQNDRMREINDWIRSQARGERGVRFVDTRAAVSSPGHPDQLVSSPDGLHPDAAGYRRMAQAIGEVVVEILR